jgi:hypothetical protein
MASSLLLLEQEARRFPIASHITYSRLINSMDRLSRVRTA